MNKKGFLRIMEVMIAITFLTIAILYIYTSKAPTQTSLDEFMHNYQKEILSSISSDINLRKMVLDNDEAGVSSFITLPDNLGFSIRICSLTNVPAPCNMDGDLRAALQNEGIYEIFADETIVATNLSSYNPKKVKLFLWQKTVV